MGKSGSAVVKSVTYKKFSKAVPGQTSPFPRKTKPFNASSKNSNEERSDDETAPLQDLGLTPIK
jgi:hypothetical protein